MTTVHKYPLSLEGKDEQIIKVPVGATILSAANQRDEIVLYVLVDTAQAISENRKVFILGTGHPAGIDFTKYTFVNTVLLFNGKRVFHIFKENL